MPQPVRQLLPGVLHWMTLHPNIGEDVSSYLLTETRVLIDPLVPVDGIEWFAENTLEPREILLSCRHHLRDSLALAERYGCGIHAPRSGMHEFTPEQGVKPYDIGATLPGGVIAHEVDAISPDETALEIPDAKALVVADGVINYGGLQFVPDKFMDDPPQTKRGLLDAFARLVDEVDFDHLLCAHGPPVMASGRNALRDFAAGMP